MRIGTVRKVVDDELCLGCGVCSAICPNSAIKMVVHIKLRYYVPEIDLDKCNSCGICAEICPGWRVDFNELNMKRFGNIPDNPYIGYSLACYLGYSSDQVIRYKGASGGCVTQLLLYALAKNIIDGALVVRPDPNNPMKPDVIIARNREDLLISQKSIYSSVPLGTGLVKIMKTPGKYAIVGLPCHLHGVLKATQNFKKLNNKIKLIFGLFCGRTFNYNGRDLFFRLNGVTPRKVRRISYRGDGWPGWPDGSKIEMKNGSVITCSGRFAKYKTQVSFDTFFRLKRCLVCIDHTCELADVSFGDPWGLLKDNYGTNIIVVRSESGRALLMQAESDGWIELEKTSIENVIKSQKSNIFRKKNIASTRCVWQALNQPLPKYNISNAVQKLRLSYIVQAAWDLLKHKISRHSSVWWILPQLFLFELILIRYPKSLINKLLRLRGRPPIYRQHREINHD